VLEKRLPKEKKMTAAVAGRNSDGVRISRTLVRIWAGLDRLYLWCGYLAAFCLVGIFATTMVQIGGRLLGFGVRGATDYAGYFMAASAFLAFAHAFNRGAHVRIELFLSLMGRLRPLAEKLSFAASAAIACWFAYHCWAMVYWSYILGDVSQGLDATPIWIPQLTMAIGVSLFALAVADHGLRLLLAGDHGIESAPDAV
jgi:TRAP-type C4-dicarboxylate transport system permease small subunit